MSHLFLLITATTAMQETNSAAQIRSATPNADSLFPRGKKITGSVCKGWTSMTFPAKNQLLGKFCCNTFTFYISLNWQITSPESYWYESLSCDVFLLSMKLKLNLFSWLGDSHLFGCRSWDSLHSQHFPDYLTNMRLSWRPSSLNSSVFYWCSKHHKPSAI